MLIDPAVAYAEADLVNLLSDVFDAGSVFVEFRAGDRLTVHREIVVGETTTLRLLFEASTETTVHEGVTYVRLLQRLGFMRESCCAGSCSHGQTQPGQATPECLA